MKRDFRQELPNRTDAVKFAQIRTLARRNKGTALTAAKMKRVHRDGAPIRLFAAGNTTADVGPEDLPAGCIIEDPSVIVKSRGHIGFAYYDKPFSHKSELWSYTFDESKINPKFAYYYLLTQTPKLQRLASGTSVKLPQLGVSDTDRLPIPVPPLEVQNEIVDILDRFTALEAELEAELEARRRQYEYYRDSLLTFSERERVEWLTLSEIGILFGGLTGKSARDFEVGDARFVPYMDVFENISTVEMPSTTVNIEDGENQRRLRRGDILFTASSESAEECGMSSVVTFDPSDPLYLNSFCFGFRPSDEDRFDPEFAKHLFRSQAIRSQIVRTANGVTRFNISKARFGKIRVPIPEKSEQRRVAGILDKFDTLTTSLTAGLPAEIAARRKQYEYYRDKLLTFKEAA